MDATFKKVAIGIGSFLIFIFAYGIARYATQEVVSSLKKTSSQETSRQAVNNYFTDTTTWKEFSSTLAKFQVLFPAYPTHESEPFEINGIQVQMETYSAEDQYGNYYTVNFATYPENVDVSVPENNLEGSVNGILRGVNGALLSSNFTNFGTNKAIEYLIKVSDQNYYVRGKNIMIGHSIYQLMTVYTKESSEIKYDQFVKSFRLK